MLFVPGKVLLTSCVLKLSLIAISYLKMFYIRCICPKKNIVRHIFTAFLRQTLVLKLHPLSFCLTVTSCDFESQCLWTSSNHSDQSDWLVVLPQQPGSAHAGMMPLTDHSEGSSDGKSAVSHWGKTQWELDDAAYAFFFSGTYLSGRKSNNGSVKLLFH